MRQKRCIMGITQCNNNNTIPTRGFSVTIYNSRGNQIAIYKCFLRIKSNQMLVFGERGKPEYPKKTSHSRVENQQTQSTYDTECENRTRAHWWKASALTTTPTLPPMPCASAIFSCCLVTLDILAMNSNTKPSKKFREKIID